MRNVRALTIAVGLGMTLGFLGQLAGAQDVGVTPAAEPTITVEHESAAPSTNTTTASKTKKKEGHSISLTIGDDDHVARHHSGGEMPSEVPLIVAIVFACPVAILGLILFYRFRKQAQLHRMLALMIEKGVPIPPEMLSERVGQAPRSDLRRGIILVCTGVGITLFFLAIKEEEWGVGIIPLMVGVGYLIAWKLQPKTQDNGRSTATNRVAE